ncbi:MAG: hypothetical protein IJ644_06075 [Oscillospiraceae bacterium]|nr:hypothetical protein [Oscillospiraceae bacterium]
MRPVFTIILGLFLSIMGGILLVHDAEYIFTGNTVNLNEIFENNQELPRDSYVDYTCYCSLGNYAETQQYLNGLIPLPFKSQEYALLTENEIIISAEISKKEKIQEMEQLTDAFFSDDENTSLVPVELVGCLQTVSPDMHNFLIEYFEGTEIAEDVITYYVIDTTKTRASQCGLCLGAILLGIFVVFMGIQRKRR